MGTSIILITTTWCGREMARRWRRCTPGKSSRKPTSNFVPPTQASLHDWPDWLHPCAGVIKTKLDVIPGMCPIWLICRRVAASPPLQGTHRAQPGNLSYGRPSSSRWLLTIPCCWLYQIDKTNDRTTNTKLSNLIGHAH